MKIHLWAPEFVQFGGGICAFSRELVDALGSLGHDLRLAGKLDTPGMLLGSPLWGAGNYPRPLANAVFATRVLADCVRYRPNHVVITHLNFGPVAYMAKLILGIPYTVVAHGIDVHQGLSERKREALRGADRLLAVSSWTRRRLLDLGGIDPSRIALLPNTVADEKFNVRPMPQYLIDRHNIAPGERVVLTVARLGPSSTLAGYKGCDRLLQALPEIIKAIGRVRYVIAGTGPDRSRLEAIARECGVAGMVTFAGFVPDHELADHYRLADVFAMPSTGEGFGIVYLEAMACGTPVLAGNTDGSVDALDQGRLGRLVDPNDLPGIAAGIVGLLRGQGSPWWFDRASLHRAAIEKFGHGAFRAKLAQVLES